MQKSDTQVPFTLSEGKNKLSIKTALVSWILLNVGMLFFIMSFLYGIFCF